VRPLKSTCATGADLDATVGVDFCHLGGLEVATVGVDLWRRSELGCGRWHRLLSLEWTWVRSLASTFATGVDLGATISVDFFHNSGLEIATVDVDLCSSRG
jgi:hypothetical protein